MPRKPVKNTVQVEEKAEVVVAPPVSESKPKGRAKAAPKEASAKEATPKEATPKEAVAKAAPQPAVVPEVVETDVVSGVEDSKKVTQRHVPTSESVEKEFDELINGLDEEIKKLRESTAKSKGVKFLRTLNKRLKVLKNHALRVSKKKVTTRRNNTNSGFLKPVQISKELAKFTGWDQNELRSRVDVTKYICNYIKEKNLQDPADKRNIRVEDDGNLKKLLKYDGKDKKPLTYYRLQTYLKGHFNSSAQA
jgi:chromatin remodeling complex protein RSC6